MPAPSLRPEARRPVGTQGLRARATARSDELEAWLHGVTRLPDISPAWLTIGDAVTMHETCFFREPHRLAVLSQEVLLDLVRTRLAQGQKALRLWSAGCASGEEAYTLAILACEALEVAGKAPSGWDIEILGNRCQRQDGPVGAPGDLGGGARLVPLPEDKNRHFEAVPGEPQRRQVSPPMRDRVRFEQHNLLEPLPPTTGADIVLCRNVFICLEDAAQARAVTLLRMALRPGGLLLLGVPDRLTMDCGFERARTGTAVICRKIGEEP